MTSRTFRPVVIIPVYNHHNAIAGILDDLEKAGLPVILVDDGSDEVCARELDRQAAARTSTTLVRLSKNSGKGAAVMAGLVTADNTRYTHALQIDADGQHDLAAIAGFLEDARKSPEALICGYPVYDDSVPASRLWGRKLSNFWVHVNTGRNAVRDVLCGLRIYPLAQTLTVLPQIKSRRMDFDPDVVVKLLWAKTEIVNRPVNVTYPADGISHFRGFSDNVRISVMHAANFFGMLRRRFSGSAS